MAQLVKPFYSPISAGSMAHTGAIPQNNITYSVISSNPNSNLSSIQRAIPYPIITQPPKNVRTSTLPPSLQVVNNQQRPIAWGGSHPGSGQANFVSPAHY